MVLAILLLNECSISRDQANALKASKNQSKIEKIIERHTDTLKVLDTLLKYRTQRINVAPDTIIIQKVDSIYGRTDSIFVGRELLKCKDSLDICQTKVMIDTEVIHDIDTIVKMDIDNTKKPTRNISDRLKDVGVGVLIGIGVKSLF
jgi:hypothetical protein